MTYETWLTRCEERLHGRVRLDRGEVANYFKATCKDLAEDGWGQTYSIGRAFDETLSRFEEQGLTLGLLREILDDWSA